MAGDRDERGNRFLREEPLQIVPDVGKGDRLVDVDDAGQRHEIRERRMTRVQHPQLVELPVVHAVGEESA